MVGLASLDPPYSFIQAQILIGPGDGLESVDESPRICYQGNIQDAAWMDKNIDILGLGCTAIDELNSS